MRERPRLTVRPDKAIHGHGLSQVLAPVFSLWPWVIASMAGAWAGLVDGIIAASFS